VSSFVGKHKPNPQGKKKRSQGRRREAKEAKEAKEGEAA
jgi:hypothetical protein